MPSTNVKVVEKVNILVPSYNEEACLERTVDALVKELEDNHIVFYEILIFDDGSSDQTYQVAQGLKEKYKNVTIYRSDQNVSLAGSFKYALSYFRCGHFTWIPADGEINPNIIVRLIEASKVNIVAYSNPQGSIAARGYFRTSLSKLYQWLMRITFNVPVQYFNGSAVYPLEVLKGIDIESEGFSVNAELIIKSAKHGLGFVPVDFILEKRMAGTPNALTVSNLYKVMKSYLKLVSIGP